MEGQSPGVAVQAAAEHTSTSSPSNRKARLLRPDVGVVAWVAVRIAAGARRGLLDRDGVGARIPDHQTRSGRRVLERVEPPAGFDLPAPPVGGDGAVDRHAHRACRDHRRQLADLPVAERDVHQHRLRRRAGQWIGDDVADVPGPLGAVPHHLDDRQQQLAVERARVRRDEDRLVGRRSRRTGGAASSSSCRPRRAPHARNPARCRRAPGP